MKKKILPIIITLIVLIYSVLIGGIRSTTSQDDNKPKVIDKSEDDSISKKYIEEEESKEQTSSKLSLEEAIELSKKKYGYNEDTLYEGENKIVEINGNRGYLIHVLSKELINQGGMGVLFSILVTEEGDIIEIE